MGLLEPEESNDLIRSQQYTETTDIPDPVLEETANAEAREPFLRARQRVPVRRRGGSRFGPRFSWANRWVRLAAVLIALACLGLLAAIAWEAKSALLHNPHFLLTSSAGIQVSGNQVVAAPDILAIFAPDIGHSIFQAPLEKRKSELERIQWVRQATVMRLWPNRLRASIVERTPIAFVRDGNAIQMVDGDGVLLDLPAVATQHYSFPVLSGISSSETPAARAARIQQYRQFVQALDAEGGHLSDTLSEVDLSDREDVRARFTGDAHQPLVHFGDKDFLPRYRAYRAHLAEWLRQYPQLQSVDMRYGRQIVLDTGTGSAPPNTEKTAAKPGDSSAISNRSAAKSKTGRGAGDSSGQERGHTVRHPLMRVVTKR